MENKNVLALQNFLYAKEYLKAIPNGYFGPGTFAAVKALQKALGLTQVGAVGPATRAYIKTATCQAGGVGQADLPTGSSTNGTQQITQSNNTVSPVALKPQLDSVDLVTIFAGGQTDWGFDVHGSNFSSATNTVYFKNLGNGMTYTIGTFASASGTAVTLPSNIGSLKFSCGNGCLQALSPGAYEISVQTAGGQTSGKFIEVRPFTIQSKTASETAPITSVGTNVKLGTLTFSTSASVIVKSVSFTMSTSTISPTGVAVTSYSDVIRGTVLDQNAELSAFQTMIVDVNASVSNSLPGTMTGFFTVVVEDYIGKKSTTFTSPDFLATVEGTL